MQKTIDWENPTKYEDGTNISQTDLSTSKVYIYKDGVEVYQTLPGITTNFPIEITPNVKNSWQLAIKINGVMSDKSAPFEYEYPLVPMAPEIMSIG